MTEPVAEPISANPTEYSTAQPAPATIPVASSASRSGATTGTTDDVATTTVSASSPGPLGTTLYTDDQGYLYLRYADGRRARIAELPSRSPSTTGPDKQAGIPMHHSALFDTAHTRSTQGSEVQGTPRSDEVNPLPDLQLDIDPNTLSNEQLLQLNAIRAHLGTANARLTTTTAMLAEQQASAEDMHDSIHAVRVEVLSRMDSLRNEVNSQRAHLNRCLDDNVCTLKDNGASIAQVNEILEVMERNQGQHCRPREEPIPYESVSSAPGVNIPADIRTSVDAMVPPRVPAESATDFDKCAAAALRSKERTHQAFPLPNVPAEDREGELDDPDDSTRRYTILNAHPLPGPNVHHGAFMGARFPTTSDTRHGGNPASEIAQLRAWRDISHLEERAEGMRMMEGASTAHRPAIAGMATTASGYHAAIGANGRDVVTEFADNMGEILRATIEHRVGARFELPPHVRPAKLDNPARYSGQDDHEVFMTCLEKLLGWMRVSNFGGLDLDSYRVSLLSGYLEGNALQWFTTEIDNPRVHGGNPLHFSDVICAMHGRYVKSSSAQRATRAFENVSYRPDKGLEKFASDLIAKGGAMIEIPSEFTLKDRFLKGIPKWIGRELKMRRGMTAQFTPWDTLRVNAHQLWETDLGMKDKDNALEASSAKTVARTTPRGAVATERAPAKSADRSYPRANPLPTATKTSSNGVRSCFSCGGTDHIAKDKVCP
ncbi:hypothetical protein B0H16DRAFT_1746156 [Mycena metata]|uniref:Uncharacterized protein n=1 Tax=Mycena metata TaxID=1033252 RepID=A0AAD7MAP4_9AGAR|nr:hypothetical protein B0H16DRAFT_1746156 [Mycena metata]